MLGWLRKTTTDWVQRALFRKRTDWQAIFPADPELEAHFADIFERVRSFTMTSRQRVRGLCHAVAWIERQEIAGDIVECGVWKGGSMMAAALTLLHLNATRRDLYLFDTFAGMSAPTEHDRDKDGQSAAQLLQDPTWSQRIICPLEQVKQNLLSTGYASERLHFIQGKVEDTLPAAAPRNIALLRLDTDWYESTYHELVHLFPRLSPGGILILDDYGHWDGARKAVDDYFARTGHPFHLLPLGNSARVFRKAG